MESRHWLVVGSTSRIGSELITFLKDAGETVLSTSRNGKNGDLAFDLTQDTLDVIAPSSRGICVVCLGVTRLQDCEDDPEASYRVNVALTQQLSRSLLRRGWKVILFSSDAVFGKVYGNPNTSRSKLHPETEYGRQKLALEDTMLNVEGVNVIRLSKVVSARQDPWKKWLHDLNDARNVEAFSDYFLRPVHMLDVLRAILVISGERQSGLWEVVGRSELSYAEFLSVMAHSLGTGGTVSAVSGADIVPVGKSAPTDVCRLEETGKWAMPKPEEVARALVDEFRSI